MNERPATHKLHINFTQEPNGTGMSGESFEDFKFIKINWRTKMRIWFLFTYCLIKLAELNIHIVLKREYACIFGNNEILLISNTNVDNNTLKLLILRAQINIERHYFKLERIANKFKIT